MSTLLLFCALIVVGAVCIVLLSQPDRRLDEAVGDALDDDPAAFRNNVRRIQHDLGPACALCGGDHTPASAS